MKCSVVYILKCKYYYDKKISLKASVWYCVVLKTCIVELLKEFNWKLSSKSLDREQQKNVDNVYR